MKRYLTPLIVSLLVTIAPNVLANELGVFPIGNSGITMTVTTAAPKGADPKSSAPPLAARRMTSLVVTFLDDRKQPAPVESLTFDAEMPEHNHGMNLKPVILTEGPGRFRIDGVKLHMPGSWKLTFKTLWHGVEQLVTFKVSV